MDRLLLFIDGLSTWVGKAFAWSLLIGTLGTSYDVFVRYAFRNPTDWAFDMSYTTYGALIMMGGAYTLARNAHVRGDVIYRLWPRRVQAGVDLVLYFLFFFPAVAALVVAGWDYAGESWSYMPYGPQGPRGEVSINSPAGVPISPLKTVLPVGAMFLFLQGIAEVIRCLMCIRSGRWPERLHDVEETEVALLAQRERALEHGLHLDAGEGTDGEARR
ncbi:TRAP transporter small permease subunit [Inmirania thermothiophila]|uniref:TRAP transporter small permease protein n=1 Tax=Inmirania thermothiophila TaxID=1750597 RepID=A0A3N1Y0I9_9GAMM|nr:TRAP transporter small permease subunit [Inmirania thermothiophila]ROR32349.1 TRAP-type mannitol/chloroaromatic compound transport system permease small subunit [Inmirania thermothiophila]